MTGISFMRQSFTILLQSLLTAPPICSSASSPRKSSRTNHPLPNSSPSSPSSPSTANVLRALIASILLSSSPGTTTRPAMASSTSIPSSASSSLLPSPFSPPDTLFPAPRISSTMGLNFSFMGMVKPSPPWISFKSIAHPTAHITALLTPPVAALRLCTRLTTATTWCAMASCMICGHKLASVWASMYWFSFAPFILTLSRTLWALALASGMPFDAISSS
mmetsp:Transcript_27755/g.52596  ORF Transcript_27755/g.52596 Transcript_27755/m.52596 type:complete len:220 (+) Transcript_27755:681-1340(+)